jgi:non-heme chloroperoxidase
MVGGAKVHYDGIVANSQTDSTAGLKTISVPVLVMHDDDEASKRSPSQRNQGDASR